MAQPQSRIIVRCEIPRAAFERLQGACERLGCTQVTLISRLVEWYAAQPKEIRSALVGWTADHRKITDLLLGEMLKGATKKRQK